MELGYLLVVNNRMATVIIVDDEADCRLQVADILASAGYNAIPVFDGITALDKVKKEQFEIVFMDLRPFPINSSEATKGYRRLFGNQPLPIIAITDFAVEQSGGKDEQRIWQEVLKHPMDPELMYQIMALMMDRHMAAV